MFVYCPYIPNMGIAINCVVLFGHGHIAERA